jgi:hypothetical protein
MSGGAMAGNENKTQPTDANPAEFIGSIADEKRRADCEALVAIMSDETGHEPVMWGESMVGFGRYTYRYASGRTGEWAITGFAPRKDTITLYFCYYLENQVDLLAKLGKHKTGKGCLYIKRLSDVDEGVLRQLIAKAVAEKTA